MQPNAGIIDEKAKISKVSQMKLGLSASSLLAWLFGGEAC